MKAWALLCLACVAAGLAFAKQPAPTPLKVVGDLYLAADGSVERIALDEGTAPVLKSVVEATVPQWRFAPVLREGVATPVRTGITLDLEGVQVDGGFRLRVKRVTFGSARTRGAKLAVPQLAANLDVLAALRVDAAGNVVDVAVVYMQGQLGDKSTHKAMQDSLERILKKSTLRPAEIAYGDSADETFLLPLDFRSTRMANGGDPRVRFQHMAPIPWLDATHQPNGPALSSPGFGAPIAMRQDDVELQTNVVGQLL